METHVFTRMVIKGLIWSLKANAGACLTCSESSQANPRHLECVMREPWESANV